MEDQGFSYRQRRLPQKPLLLTAEVTSLDKRRKLIVAVFSALLMMSFRVGTAKADTTEWTQNATFNRYGYQWDLILYEWEWSQSPFWDGTTFEVWDSTILNHIWWDEDGIIDLAASDGNPYDAFGRSARVTYGVFILPYSDVPPNHLTADNTNGITLRGIVSDYGSSNWDFTFTSWTGIKFDAWFTDPLNNGRKLVIEMYFHGTGLQGTWGNKHFRTLGSDDEIDDLMIKLQAFPEYCTMTGDIPESNFGLYGDYWWNHTKFTINLKAIWEKARAHFNRSYGDQLYAVALDVETCWTIPLEVAPFAIAEVNEIKVTWLGSGGGGGGGRGPWPCPYSDPYP